MIFFSICSFAWSASELLIFYTWNPFNIFTWHYFHSFCNVFLCVLRVLGSFFSIIVALELLNIGSEEKIWISIEFDRPFFGIDGDLFFRKLLIEKLHAVAQKMLITSIEIENSHKTYWTMAIMQMHRTTQNITQYSSSNTMNERKIYRANYLSASQFENIFKSKMKNERKKHIETRTITLRL